MMHPRIYMFNQIIAIRVSLALELVKIVLEFVVEYVIWVEAFFLQHTGCSFNHQRRTAEKTLSLDTWFEVLIDR